MLYILSCIIMCMFYGTPMHIHRYMHIYISLICHGRMSESNYCEPDGDSNVSRSRHTICLLLTKCSNFYVLSCRRHLFCSTCLFTQRNQKLTHHTMTGTVVGVSKQVDVASMCDAVENVILLPHLT